MESWYMIPAKQKPRYLYTIVSVAAVLFLLGFLGLLLLQSRQLTRLLKEQVDIIVELVPEVEEADRKALKVKLSQAGFTLPGSVSFTPKEVALKEMSQEIGEDSLCLDMPNPLYDVFTFHVHATYLHTDSLAAIREVLVSDASIQDVYYQENLVEQLAANTGTMSWVLLGMAFLFVLLAITVIHNTIRLAMYANRFLIKTQELVGAS
ncbi:MAG: permease-like cell division protein FtsX [Saprospiraceae bacterium]